MAEEKNEIRTITPAKVEQRSVVKDLAKYAMDEYIKPKTNDVLHDLFSGVVDMFGDAIRGAIDKQFYGEVGIGLKEIKCKRSIRMFHIMYILYLHHLLYRDHKDLIIHRDQVKA